MIWFIQRFIACLFLIDLFPKKVKFVIEYIESIFK